ncbi:MAG: formylglycine-generating enzyme family protein [Pseudanabaena sp. ELA607]
MLPLLHDHYQLIQHLGNGVLGQVYLAQDLDIPVSNLQGSNRYLINYLGEYLATTITYHDDLFSYTLQHHDWQNIIKSLCIIHCWDMGTQTATAVAQQIDLYEALLQQNKSRINLHHNPKILAHFVIEHNYYLVQEFQLNYNYLNLDNPHKTQAVLPLPQQLNNYAISYWSNIHSRINQPNLSRQQLLKYGSYLLAGSIGFSLAMITQWWREQMSQTAKSSLPKNLLPQFDLPTLPTDPVARGEAFFSESIISNNQKINLEMMRVPAGTFLMGSPNFEAGRKDNESPEIVIGLPAFYIGKFTITQQQWQSIMGYNPANFRTDILAPVENISWHEAQDFCKKLSRKTGRIYRLPTESEWEYACRAPARNQPKTAFTFGNDRSQLTDYGWFKNNSGEQSHSVGQKLPNAWGLHDMHGGVWEWCEDVWHDQLREIPPDGSPRITGNDLGRRTRRGGSWSNEALLCRSASRDWHGAGDRYNDIGLRVALSIPAHPIS